MGGGNQNLHRIVIRHAAVAFEAVCGKREELRRIDGVCKRPHMYYYRVKLILNYICLLYTSRCV